MSSIFVVDDHNEAQKFIQLAVRTNQLRLGSTMVHFDSHPDLLIDPSLTKAQVHTEPQVVRASMRTRRDGICEWILPLVFQGVLNSITWVRGDVETIRDVEDREIAFGFDEAGRVAVSADEDYFSDHGIHRDEICDPQGVLKLSVTASAPAIRADDWALDVCLDYFAVQNPFALWVARLCGGNADEIASRASRKDFANLRRRRAKKPEFMDELKIAVEELVENFDLPHGNRSEEAFEIFDEFLESVGSNPPKVITIARSDSDELDFTPVEESKRILEKVLASLNAAFPLCEEFADDAGFDELKYVLSKRRRTKGHAVRRDLRAPKK